MAEWTGRKRTLNSIVQEGDPPENSASDRLAPPPEAPGAVSSPQQPGMTPDQPDLPGRERHTLSALANTRRPLTEYGSAQRILHLFTPAPGTELEAEDWEQGPASFEEQRKVDPALGMPFRPLTGYGLGIGRTTPAIPAEALEALSDPTGISVDISEPAAAAPVAPAAALAGTSTEASSIASDVPAGAVRGDGSAVCPPGFPVKGNAQSKIYHAPESRVYEQTIAELCFATAEAAHAAGYRPPKNL
jgi:hypothetical protein